MLTVSPFFIDSFIPTLSAHNMHHCRLDSQEKLVRHLEPNYSLTENSQAACLEVELPGVAKENVKLHLAGNKMVLTAKRFSQNVEAEQKENSHDEKETKPNDVPKPSVVYELKLHIGNRYDLEHIEASMEGHGLLKLTIPTRKMDTPRNIEIQ